MANLIEDTPRPVVARPPRSDESADPGRIVLVATTVVAVVGALCGSDYVRGRFIYPLMYGEGYLSTISWHGGLVLTWPGWSMNTGTISAVLASVALAIAVGATHIASDWALRRRRVVTGGRVFASTWLVVFLAAAIAGVVQTGLETLIGADSTEGAPIWAGWLAAGYAAGWGLLTGLLAATSTLIFLRLFLRLRM